MLNDVLMEHFSLITSKAVQVVKRGENKIKTQAEVKRIVSKVATKQIKKEHKPTII